MLGFRKLICPYCFEPFAMRAAPFRCTSVLCAPVSDPVWDSVWGGPGTVGLHKPLVRARGLFTSSVRCPACRQKTTKRACPHCHADLHPSFGAVDNLTFALVGAKDSGKSHYIAVLIEHFRQRVGPALNLLLSPDDTTIKSYNEKFRDPVFKAGQVIRSTASAKENRQVGQPLFFVLEAHEAYRKGKTTRTKKSVTLAFFDTAGEDLNDQDTMSTVNKYIYRADGIILLLDPLQLPSVRARLQGSTALPERNSETEDILMRVTSLIQTARGMSATSPIPVPLAVAFSKLDAILPLADPQMQLHATPNHERGFDTGDHEAVNAEMQSLLSSWHGDALLHQVRLRYPKHGFFALSALGCNPHGNRTIPRVVPRRIEDPFLWLLHQHGIVEAAMPGARR